MRLPVDGQFPRRLTRELVDGGHDAIHTPDLPNRNTSTDREVTAGADRESRIVVSKDVDFQDGHLLRGAPRRLLLVRTGNIGNAELLALFAQHLPDIEAAFDEAAFDEAAMVELAAGELVIHPRA